MNILIDKKFLGKKLIDVLFLSLDWNLSKRKLKSCIESGVCFVNGQVERFACYQVNKGDQIQFETHWIKSVSTIPAVPKVLFEDEHLLVCDKPAGICSDNDLTHYFGKENVYIVHRLDKGTTGVIVLAKTCEACKQMHSLFKFRKIQKSYLALCFGTPHKKKGVVRNHLGKIGAFSGQVLWGEVPQGKEAVTYWSLLETQKQYSLIECQPHTGRTHQIRVHLASIKCPIVGDYQYYRQQKPPFFVSRPLLHAKTLAFIHPLTNKELHFTSKLPFDFKNTLNYLDIK